jgi:beta-lactam-binding protein with PASTA domain
VPDVRGLSLSAARKRLAEAGFRMAQLDPADGAQCASSVTAGDVAFYGPHRAPKGVTITVCPSSGAQQSVYVPPPPPPPPTYIPPPTTYQPPVTSSSAPSRTPQARTSSKPRPTPKPKPSKTKKKPPH